MSEREPVSAIAAALATRIEALCRDLLPMGRRIGREWKIGSIEGEEGDSMGVVLAGARQGIWRDFHGPADHAGDALDLVRMVKGFEMPEALDWARRWLGRPVAEIMREQPKPERLKVALEAEAEARRKGAYQLWTKARAIAGTGGESYLRSRGLTLALPKTLRFLDRSKHGPANLWLPCIIACVQDRDGKFLAVHRTFIARKDGGWGKATDELGKDVRLTYGPARGGAIRLKEAGPGLALAEGIETALSVAQACAELTVWSTLDAGKLRVVDLPPDRREIVIFADNDEPNRRRDGSEDHPGQDAAIDLARRLAREGRKVKIALPPKPGTDFNDMLRGAA